MYVRWVESQELMLKIKINILFRVTSAGCPTGRFFSEVTGECEYCPVGTYQDSPDSIDCKSCPHGTNTTGPGTINLTQCLSEWTIIFVRLLIILNGISQFRYIPSKITKELHFHRLWSSITCLNLFVHFFFRILQSWSFFTYRTKPLCCVW